MGEEANVWRVSFGGVHVSFYFKGGANDFIPPSLHTVLKEEAAWGGEGQAPVLPFPGSCLCTSCSWRCNGPVQGGGLGPGIQAACLNLGVAEHLQECNQCPVHRAPITPFCSRRGLWLQAGLVIAVDGFPLQNWNESDTVPEGADAELARLSAWGAAGLLGTVSAVEPAWGSPRSPSMGGPCRRSPAADRSSCPGLCCSGGTRSRYALLGLAV